MKRFILSHIWPIVFMPVILFSAFLIYAYEMDNYPSKKPVSNQHEIVKK